MKGFAITGVEKISTETHFEDGDDPSTSAITWSCGDLNLFALTIKCLLRAVERQFGLDIDQIWVPTGGGETEFSQFVWDQLEGDDGMAFLPHEEAQWRLGLRRGWHAEYRFEIERRGPSGPVQVRDLVNSGFAFNG